MMIYRLQPGFARGRVRRRSLPDLRTGPASRLLALALLPVFACHAARPLSTDDAAVQAVGECEMDSYAGRATARREAGSTAAATQLGCGVVPGTYLGLAYGRTLTRQDVEQTLALAGKTSLREADDEIAGYAISWGTVGRKVRGTAFRYDGWYATVARTAGLAAGWTSHANLGLAAQHGSQALTARWSVAIEHALAGGARAGLESWADSHDHTPWVQAGASCDLAAKGLSINASWGAQFKATHDRLATVGATFDF